MPTTEPIGDLLDSLGVTRSPLDGEIVSAAVVVLKVIDADGDVHLQTAHSDGISWIERIGMLTTAQAMETAAIRDEGCGCQ